MPLDFRLRSRWSVDADPAVVLATLADVTAYPAWWQSVVEAHAEEDGGARLVVRGRAPMRLGLRLARMDAPEGALAARMRGDLLGWCTWHVAARAEGGTSIVFQQHVIARRRALRAAARVAPGRLRAQHAAVMRMGEHGLRAHLEPRVA